MAIYGTTPIAGVNLQQIDTVGATLYPAYTDTLPMAIGSQVVATNDSVWVYTQVDTSATLAYGNVCTIDPLTFKAKPIVGGGAAEDTKFLIGFYQNTTSAVATNGVWLMIRGVPTISVLASCAKAVQLYTTDTSGALDDAVATGSQYPVKNVYLLTTNGATASTGAAQASYPAVGPLGSL